MSLRGGYEYEKLFQMAVWLFVDLVITWYFHDLILSENGRPTSQNITVIMQVSTLGNNTNIKSILKNIGILSTLK